MKKIAGPPKTLEVLNVNVEALLIHNDNLYLNGDRKNWPGSQLNIRITEDKAIAYPNIKLDLNKIPVISSGLDLPEGSIELCVAQATYIGKDNHVR